MFTTSIITAAFFSLKKSTFSETILGFSITDRDRKQGKLRQNPCTNVLNFRNVAGVEVADSVEEKLRTRLLHQAIIRVMLSEEKKDFFHNSR